MQGSALGQQHQFPLPKASACYRFGQETFAERPGNERDAPKSGDGRTGGSHRDLKSQIGLGSNTVIQERRTP
jgi:hypothetical protein